MPLPKARDLRSLTTQKLLQKRQGLEKELFELRRKKITGQLDKPHLFKVTRKQVAQLHTLLREKSNG